jgi:hypothetical protein
MNGQTLFIVLASVLVVGLVILSGYRFWKFLSLREKAVAGYNKVVGQADSCIFYAKQFILRINEDQFATGAKKLRKEISTLEKLVDDCKKGKKKTSNFSSISIIKGQIASSIRDLDNGGAYSDEGIGKMIFESFKKADQAMSDILKEFITIGKNFNAVSACFPMSLFGSPLLSLDTPEA